jgi:hypothetical protein
MIFFIHGGVNRIFDCQQIRWMADWEKRWGRFRRDIAAAAFF